MQDEYRKKRNKEVDDVWMEPLDKHNNGEQSGEKEEERVIERRRGVLVEEWMTAVNVAE